MKVDIDLICEGKGETEELTNIDINRLEDIVKSHLPAREVKHITIHEPENEI